MFCKFSKNHLLRVLKIIWWIKDEQVKREPNPLAAAPTLDSSFCPSSAHTDFDLGKRESLANILISADVCSAAAWHATATRPGSTWPLTRRYRWDAQARLKSSAERFCSDNLLCRVCNADRLLVSRVSQATLQQLCRKVPTSLEKVPTPYSSLTFYKSVLKRSIKTTWCCNQ